MAMSGTYDPSDPYANQAGSGETPPQPGWSYQPYHAPVDPNAPYGYDRLGRPLSDKSKIVAGLLQLLLGFFFALGGVGRLYAGNVGLGVAQLVATVIGWASFVCGFFLVLPFVVSGAIWLWFVIDGIILLAGDSRDGQGRPLRA
jgi:TM2 domain-containing membrane protein YozV